jgi:eukaryotic-like serine/threonine-protein kinase
VFSAAPQIVGRYAIHGEIASGGMASVHFARRVGPAGFARTVAIKRAHPHLAKEHEFALMFLDEARLAARVQHPNVVSTVDVLQTDDELVLVMDYVHGESLWRLTRTARERGEGVPLAVATAIVVDVLHGLHAAHEATDEQGAPLNIVHRDVSPQNILVGVDGVARLVDFGIAKAAGRLHSTRDSAVKGKYAYMAPEQARGEPVTRLADTYAAAIVLWELVTGERLFAGKTEAETIHRCLVARVRPPSAFVALLPPKLDEILTKGLSRNLSQRYATAREMALDLESCLPAVHPSEVGAWVERMAGDTLAARARIVADIERGTDPGGTSRTASEVDTVAPVGRKRRAVVWMGAALAGLLVVGGAVAMRGIRVPAAAASVDPIATAGAPSQAAVVAPESAPASASAAAVASAPGSASAPAPASTPTVAASVTRPARAPVSPRSAHPRRAKNCDPPYSIDAQGREIFKPECM